MKKEIKISGRPVEFNSSAGWLYIYKEQFGHDILPDLMPALEAFLLTVGTVAEKAEDGILAGLLDNETIGEIVATLSGLEFTTAINIAWSMAKNADESIESPYRWVNQFDTLPGDELIPQLLELVLDSSISKKNGERIREAIEKLRGNLSKNSGLTSSQSQQQIED